MRSMTGFGRATRETPLGRLTLELRSVNNRFLELNFRLGQMFIPLEGELRNRLRERLSRGKVDVTARFDPSASFEPGVALNTELLKSLMDQLESLGKNLSSVQPEALLNVPGALLPQSNDEKTAELNKELLELADEAAAALITEREREGETIRASLRANEQIMREKLEAVSAGRAEVVEKYRERLHARLDELLGPKAASLDPGRLEQEVALFADKADIAEECGRLAAHFDALRDLLAKEGEAVGRQLEFLAQEMLREVNTIGSKCRDLEISRHVLDLKNELETVRENIANVE